VNLKERDHYDDIGIDRMMIIKWILKKWLEGVWSGFIWLSTGTIGGHL
jgi:hypothetical protein